MPAPWWTTTTVYHLYVRSFFDSNGDGIGDLPGVLARLDHLQDLGVETVWLSPFFPSPQRDFGYDVTDYLGVAPEYGTAADLRALVDALHRRGMKVMFDLVLNHTSDQHPWFLESARAKDSPRRDWYLWRAGNGRGGGRPPNHWRSMLGPSGWHRHPATGEWYWASFLPFQPDLNWRHPEVREAMLGVVRHWIAEGVDGFRLDVFGALFKDAAFRENPRSLRAIPREDDPAGFFQRPEHTLHQPETFALARELRALGDAATPPRIFLGEVFGDGAVLRRYLGEHGEGLNLVFFFKALRLRFSARDARALLDEAERTFTAGLLPAWAFGNHDRPRSIARLGGDERKAGLLAALQLTVRGVPVVYYGEELGLGHLDLPLRAAKDPVASTWGWIPGPLQRWLEGRAVLLNRDLCRAPMAWTSAPHGGFSTATPWLPAVPDAAARSVERQREAPLSLLNTYRRLLRLRQLTPALHGGALELLPAPAQNVVAFVRRHAEGDAAVLLNFGERPVEVSLQGLPGRSLTSTAHPAPREPGDRYTLGPWEGAVLTSR